MPFPSLMHPEALLTERCDDNIQLDEDIELLTSSWLSTSLPKRYQEPSDSASLVEGATLLELELGIDPDRDVEDEDDELGIDPDRDVEDEDDDALDRSSTPSKNNNKQTETERHDELQKSAMEILRNFDPQNPPATNDPEELQLWLECAAQREAVLRYQNLVKKARDRKAYDSMGLMQRHIVQWFEDLKSFIEIRQKEYLSNKDRRRAKTRYGPFLCSLPPEKMAVIASHEAMTQSLLFSGKTGREGVPLAKLAAAIGAAVETEVLSQQRMKERFFDPNRTDDVDKNEDVETDKTDDEEKHAKDTKRNTASDRWKFSASHLKLFIADLQRMDPKMGKKNKRSIAAAMLRAKRVMDNEQGWTKDDAIHLGAALLSILVENTKINNKGKQEPAFKVEKRWTPTKKSISFVVLNENLYRMFTEDELLSWAASTTRYTPMIVPPSEWNGPRKGGYRWLEASLMRTHGSQVQNEALQHGDLSLVYDGLNILGRTAWKINKDILGIGKTCWNRNIPIGDIPSRTDLEVPPEPQRPERISPELYADKLSPEAKAAMEARKEYRDSIHKRQRVIQKNMVSEIHSKNIASHSTFSYLTQRVDRFLGLAFP